MPSRLRLVPARANKNDERYGGLMKFKFVVSVIVLALFVFAAATQAQERQVIDVGVSYSYVRYNPATSGLKNFSMNGGSGSVALNFNSWLSGVADVGGYSKHNILGNGVSGSLSTYLFGPRVTLNRYGRVTPFGQVLLGIAHTGGRYLTTGGSQTPFTAAIGGGIDWRWTNHIRLRAGEVDYLLTHFGEVTNANTQVQSNLRVSSGLVFRF
jgi:outer membrane protein with beta-barrel domain